MIGPKKLWLHVDLLESRTRGTESPSGVDFARRRRPSPPSYRWDLIFERSSEARQLVLHAPQHHEEDVLELVRCCYYLAGVHAGEASFEKKQHAAWVED